MALPDTERELEENRYEPDVADDDDTEDDSFPIYDYDLVSTPNDFNTMTIVDFIDKGVVKIPGFQRNYVWDIKRASRLIESIIVGLPIPQIFLYERGRNDHWVIDGQQRLMSIYYFVKGRFPKRDKIPQLRTTYDSRGIISTELLANNEYYNEFRLSLPEGAPGNPNKFHRHSYCTLDEDTRQGRFDFRTIRNMVIRQVKPEGDDAMYEIFNRLNSGGINLTSQEIRRCAYDSKFYDMLYQTNTVEKWRNLVGARIPDLHMKDVEILLRGFAMLIQGESYRPSMVKFLNTFSKQAKSFDEGKLVQLQQLLDSFLDSCADIPSGAFHSTPGRFSPMIFESVFVAACLGPYTEGTKVQGKISLASLESLKADSEFRSVTQSRTTDPTSVKVRLSRAQKILTLA
jgi:hypothetical protein